MSHPALIDGSFAHLRLGALAPRKDVRTLQLAKYLDDTVVLPVTPTHFDYTTKVVSWPMYGNDRLGDCTCAAAGHMIQAWNAAALKFTNPPTEQAVEHFYIPVTGSQDDGRVEIDVLNAWRHTGIGSGLVDKIGAYVQVNPKNHAHMKAAIWLFGGVYVGIALPLSAQRETKWTVGTGANGVPGSWGGHAVPYLAYTATTFKCVTWGGLMPLTAGFNNKYTEEAYAIISPDFFNPSHVSPQGFDIATLTADLAAL